jgi:hypothetical protein
VTDDQIELVREISLLRQDINYLRNDFAEVKQHVDDLRDLKSKGMGVFFALTLFGSVILLGFKEFLSGL